MDATQFLAMNGYALYVWGSYGIAGIAYAGLLLHAVISYERQKKRKKQQGRK